MYMMPSKVLQGYARYFLDTMRLDTIYMIDSYYNSLGPNYSNYTKTAYTIAQLELDDTGFICAI